MNSEEIFAQIKRVSVLHYVIIVGVFIHSLVILWPILGSPFSGDDTFDSMVPMQLHYSEGSYWSWINSYISNWSTNEGRFFPVAATTGVLSHYFFPGRVEYKVVQLIVVLVALFVFSALVSKLFKSIFAGILAALILNTCLQMHVQYDPLFQFSLQQPFLMIVMSGTLLFFISGLRRGNTWKLALSAVLYLLALLAYESTLLIWPIFLILIYIERPQKYLKAALISALPALLVGLNLMRLRSKVTTTSAGYTSNFEIARLAKTFTKQAIGSIPMSYSQLRTPPFLQSFPTHLRPSSFSWLVAVGIAVLVVFLVVPKIAIVSHKVNLGAVLAGLLLWFVPALVVGQTVRWQDELVLGNAYITWFQGSLGFTLIVAGALNECKILFLKCHWSISVGAISAFALIIAIATSSVVTNNPRAIAQFNPGYLWPRETFESSIEAGVFNDVSPKQPLLALGAEWWLNAPFVYWWGGPKIEQMDSQRTETQWGSCVAEPSTCLERLGYRNLVAAYGHDYSGPRVVMVGLVETMTGTTGVISSATVVAPRVFVDYPSKSPSEVESKQRCLGWGKAQILKSMSSVEDDDLKVLEARKESCLLKFSSRISFDPYQFNPN